MIHPLRTLTLAALCLLTSACSLTGSQPAPCTEHSACHATFGLGTVCGTQGYCRDAPEFPRCDTSLPQGLLTGEVSPDELIVLGSLQDRSLATQRARERSVQLAVEQANAQGGLEGRTFGVMFCTVEQNAAFDELTRTEAAVAAAQHLVNAYGVTAIIGPSASVDTAQVFTALRHQQVLVFSPSATSPALTTMETDTPGLLWRAAPPDSLQATAIVNDMITPGPGRTDPVNNVHVVAEAGVYGEELSRVFFEQLTALGGTATLASFSNVAERAEAISAAATDTAAQEVLFIGQTAHAIAFMDAAAALPGFQGKGLFLTDTAANDDFLLQANDARFGAVRGTRPAPLDDTTDFVYAAFVAAYQSQYAENVRHFSFTAHSYDSAWLVMYGAAWALLQEGAVTGPNIAAGLRQISNVGAPPIEIRATAWQTVVERFRAGQSVNLRGASGELDYDPTTEEVSGPVEVWTIGPKRELVPVHTWLPP